MRTSLCVLSATLALTTGACATSGYRFDASAASATAPRHRAVVRPVTGCAADEAPYDCDRRAILAMVGEYEVSFAFDETVVLAAEYTRRESQRSGGFETVVVVEDTPRRIVLQHILVAKDGRVTKHWRQDWQYETPTHWEYAGDQRFAPKARPADSVEGTWTQLVYEVSDAPRYAGSGRWNHKYGVSTWTSDRSWRPLPRREYTKRDDYDLINAENRHTITPTGFTHEQDNTKVVRREGRDRTLVREFGFNDYRRIEGYDFTPAYDFWAATAPFWAGIRARWDELLADHAVRLAFPAGDEKMITAVFESAEAYRANPADPAVTAKLDTAFATYVDDGTRVARH